MLRFVLRALIGARIAHIGTELINRPGELAATRHVACGKAANLGTIHIEGDAATHHFYIVLSQACAGAGVACKCARIAGIDGRLVLFDIHGKLHLVDE